MNRDLKTISIASLWIASACAIAMFGTFLSDYLTSINWFKDQYVEWVAYGQQYSDWEWSMRHNWYVATFVVLFAGTCINALYWTINRLDEP